jgi:glycosyltransferase involved in cell wall biosynthesis
MVRNPISLLFFTNTVDRGGAEEHILTLLRGLDRHHFRICLVCPLQLADQLRSDVPADVELVPLDFFKPTRLAAALRFSRIIRARRVDILHSHMFCSSLAASPVGWFCRVPVIIETPHVRESWRKGWFKSRFFVDRLVGRFVDHYVAVSAANGAHLAETKGLPKRKIVVIRNGSDLSRFAPAGTVDSDPKLGRMRRDLGFKPDDLVLIVAARLEPQKGHRVLMEAMPLILRNFPTVRLVCVGDGRLRSELERQKSELGLEDSVRLVGFQPDVAAWLSMGDITVLPSFYEGLPLVAIESLAVGRPVVATAVDGTPEVILDGRTGFTVPPGDAPSLAEAIGRLLRDPDLRRSFGRAGRSFVLEHFTQERQIAQTQQLYFDALRQRKARPFPVEGAVKSGAAGSAG